MSEYSWIEYMLRKEGFNVSPKLKWFLLSSKEAIDPYFLLTEEWGVQQLASMHERLSDVTFVAFARRRDDDIAIGVVLDGLNYKRGQVLVVFDDVTTPPIVENVYPSLDTWADAMWDDIADFHASRG